MSCNQCGQACTGRLCQDCGLVEKWSDELEQLADVESDDLEDDDDGGGAPESVADDGDDGPRDEGELVADGSGLNLRGHEVATDDPDGMDDVVDEAHQLLDGVAHDAFVVVSVRAGTLGNVKHMLSHAGAVREDAGEETVEALVDELLAQALANTDRSAHDLAERLAEIQTTGGVTGVDRGDGIETDGGLASDGARQAIQDAAIMPLREQLREGGDDITPGDVDDETIARLAEAFVTLFEDDQILVEFGETVAQARIAADGADPDVVGQAAFIADDLVERAEFPLGLYAARLVDQHFDVLVAFERGELTRAEARRLRDGSPDADQTVLAEAGAR